MSMKAKSRARAISNTIPDSAFDARIESRRIDELRPYARNARTHSKKQVGQIAESIKRFGFTNPVLIDEKGGILAGHGRVAAARRIGMETVPCLRIETLSDAEKRAYILADNKLAEQAGWDEEILADELAFLVEESPEIDVTLTGFSIAEIDEILEPGGTDPASEAKEDERLPLLRKDLPPISQPGDLWQLGEHRLLCGDALDRGSYDRLMEEPAQMVFTDPPYNVPVNGHVLGKSSDRHPEFAMASGEMSDQEFAGFLSTAFAHLVANSDDGAIHFICMDWRHMAHMLEAGQANYGPVKNLVVWVKDNGGMGSFYRSRHELIFVFKSGTGSHINSFELGQHGRYRTNVWNYRGTNSAAGSARDERAMHPTVKPVAMVADALKDCSRPGGVVLDPFGGAGTLLIAAQKTRRRARVIEIDPHYCDTAIRRWQAFAHDDARLVETGRTFAELSVERGACHD